MISVYRAPSFQAVNRCDLSLPFIWNLAYSFFFPSSWGNPPRLGFRRWRTIAYATFILTTYHTDLLSQQKSLSVSSVGTAWMFVFLPPLRCPAVWQHLQFHSCKEGQFHRGGPASGQSLRREDETVGGSHPKVMPPPTAGLAPSVSLYQFLPLVMVISPALRHPEKLG